MTTAGLKLKPITSLVLLLFLSAGCGTTLYAPPTPLCSNEWFEYVESEVGTGDGRGHGPGIGSAEWKSVVEFKLGIRGDSNVPNQETREWCVFINRQLSNREA